jgi:CRISPR-associated protein Csx10
VDFERLSLTADGADRLKKDLWAEAVRTLVDACIRAQKRETERTDNSKKGDEANGAQD